MTTNLVLSGGPTHDLAATSAQVARVLALEGIESVVVDDLRAALARLADAPDDWDLVTVNALRWQMEADRYEPLRDEWSFALSDDEADVLAAHVRRRGGLLALHTAVVCFDGHPIWRDLLGASWDWDDSSHPPVGDVLVSITEAGRTHPITEGLAPFVVEDEVYGDLDRDPALVPLLVSTQGGRDHPLLWARRVGEGRVVTSLLGHSAASLAHPTHAEIIRRSARWALAQEDT